LDSNERNELLESIIEIQEKMLHAQLNVIKKIRQRDKEKPAIEKGMSKIDAALYILKTERRPLHITELIKEIEKRYHIEIERDSLVSALSKKLNKIKELHKVGRNTFHFSDE
jgi:hypothetical protein